VITGNNGAGKSSLLEAIAYASLGRSFRGSPRESLIRNGADRAIVRIAIASEGRQQLVEIEIANHRRDRVFINHSTMSRLGDLLEVLRVTVFTPDDLALVKGPPQERREYLDGALVAVIPRFAAVCQELDRVLRQRASLLRQAGGRLSPGIATTLDVWDEKFVGIGQTLTAARRDLASRLQPFVGAAFTRLTGIAMPIQLEYVPSYAGDLQTAIAEARTEDVRRGLTTVGPHRDELRVSVDDLDARTRLSQGRQRAVTLALRLGAHLLVTEATGTAPVLLLDDAFSELDERTSTALVRELPPGQAMLTTAGEIPPNATVARAVHIVSGSVQ
jgi:DNA replication and repair protein RecF